MPTELSDPVYKEIVTCRIKLLLEKPFFGNIATRLIAVEAPWCRTAATDGRHLYYNREFVKNLSRPHLLFLIVHEIYHCFPPGTIIPGAYKPIEEFITGDHVIGSGGVHSTVVAPMCNWYDGDMFTIKARGMLPLTMTEEHPVLVSRPTWKHVMGHSSPTGKRTNIREFSEPVWKKASEVVRGDWVQIPRVKGNIKNHRMEFLFSDNPWSSPEKIRGDIILDADMASFIGTYVAEGSTTVTKNNDYMSVLSLSFEKEKQLAEKSKEFLYEKLGISAHFQEKEENGVRTVNFSSAPLGRWLRDNCGHGAHNKRIPDAILYNEDLNILKSFLCAYTKGDDWHNNKMVSSATVSKTLILQLQLAWARLGVLFNIYEDNPQQRESGKSIINGKVIQGGTIYRGMTTSQLALDVFGITSYAKRPTNFSRTFEDAIFTPVSKIITTPYEGVVYNFETSCNTYAAGNMITHNCLLDHIGRRGNRDKDIFNMACDYVINYSIVEEKIGTMPEMGLYDEKYTSEMTAEEVYEILKKNSVTIKMPLDDHLDLGNDSSDDDNEDPIDRSGKDKKKKKGKGQGEDDSEDEDGKPGGKGKGNGGGKGKSVSVTVMGKDGPPKLSEEELQKIRNEMKAAIISAAQSVGAGNLPLGVRRMISELVEPKLDWRTLLDAHIRSQVKDDYTFQRLSRRTWGTGAIMPAQNFIDRVECWCAIDASGSTTDEMVTEFLSEVKGIMEQFRDFKIGILCFDTEVYNVYELTPENFDDVYNYKIKGGGGTIFSAVFEFFKREGIEPNRLAFFTDGLPNDGTWGDPDYCDTIFIIHSNPGISAPHGLTCHYDPPKQKR